MENSKGGLIAPSIAAADLGRLREEVRGIEAAGADLIHIDIMDGSFVPNITFGPWILDVVRSVSNLPLDCHLMVSHPRDWIPTLAQAGADCITIHIESTPQIHRQIENIKKLGKRAGISLNPGNPISLIEELLGWVDVVQVMSVDPGFSGQSFLPNALKKVRRLDDLRGEQKYWIKVDGGITSENIASIRAAGTDVFVLGSSIFSHPDRRAVIESLKNQIK
jgi:ribulose-phosphate 3-epimerase